jgi:hypothetical protein
MTLAPWLARALRRFVGRAAMAVGGQAFIHGLVFPDPEMPPADVDRVEVSTGDGFSYEIHDAAVVARATGFTRSLDGRWTYLPGSIGPSPMQRATFYRGDHAQGWVMWNEEVAVIPARDGSAVFRLGPGEAAAFGRLLGLRH